jgi:hypothetical protein
MLLTNLENWFAIKMDDQAVFDSEMISLKRMLRRADPSELLFLLEKILVVAIKGDMQETMIERILNLAEEAQTDLQILIERALGMKPVIEVEYVESENGNELVRKSK